jgi:hypothetical protein
MERRFAKEWRIQHMPGDAAAPHVAVFLSYRREDTQWAAARISDRLVQRYGRENVFRDLDAIPPGAKFRDFIARRISESDIFILLIGQAWASVTDDTGRRRLEQPRDPVRLEVEIALRAGIQIIPVRVEGARMPTEQDLIPSIVDILEFNATEVSDYRWEHDITKLFEAIDNVTGSDPDRGRDALSSGVVAPGPSDPSATAAKHTSQPESRASTPLPGDDRDFPSRVAEMAQALAAGEVMLPPQLRDQVRRAVQTGLSPATSAEAAREAGRWRAFEHVADADGRRIARVMVRAWQIAADKESR